MNIPVAHIESGLRSFDRNMPEEKNRILVDHISDLLFVSEISGIKNLKDEGISGRMVHLVGNCMIDSLISILPKAKEKNLGKGLIYLKKDILWLRCIGHLMLIEILKKQLRY